MFFFFFSVVYLSRGTLPQKRGEKGTTGGRGKPASHASEARVSLLHRWGETKGPCLAEGT